MTSASKVDLSSGRSFVAGFPHQFFSWLRREHPVWWHQPTVNTPDGVGFWVIDYKTSSHQGGAIDEFIAQELERYRPQMQRYVALASAVDTSPVRAALYFPLLGEFHELQIQTNQ